MIASKDRSGWFGASDVDKITAKNVSSDSWRRWWMVKLGIRHDSFVNTAMVAGTYKEHMILDFIGALEKDRQILLPNLRLRVNLDGNTGAIIHEVKTFAYKPDWKPPHKYIRQVQVQMFAASSEQAEIVAYGMTEDDYLNFFLPIDPDRLFRFPVSYDRAFIDTVFLPRLKTLADCLQKGVMPDGI